MKDDHASLEIIVNEEPESQVLTLAADDSKILIVGGGSRVHLLVNALVESGLCLLSSTVLKPLEIPEIPSWALDLRCYDDYRMPESYGSPFSKDMRNRDYIQQKHAAAHKRRNVRKWR